MHRLGACFRAKLQKCRDSDGDEGDATEQIEIEAARTVEGLIGERVLPLMSEESQRFLEERLLSRMSQIAVE
jgi:hypothetical protein